MQVGMVHGGDFTDGLGFCRFVDLKTAEVLSPFVNSLELLEKAMMWITPDGSRGPIYEAKPGAILLARITKSPICLLSFKYSGHWALRSWDRFVIPFPFSRVKYIHILSSEVLFKEGCDDKAKEIAQSGLMKITQD